MADIFSALCGARSYKKPFEKERVVGILKEMRDQGLLDTHVVKACVEHFGEIHRYMEGIVRPYEDTFAGISREFAGLKAKFM